jgi:hypothetical protein
MRAHRHRDEALVILQALHSPRALNHRYGTRMSPLRGGRRTPNRTLDLGEFDIALGLTHLSIPPDEESLMYTNRISVNRRHTAVFLLFLLFSMPVSALDRRIPVPTLDIAANKDGPQRRVAPAINAIAPEPSPVYKPPLRGAPGSRMSGGTRGISETLLSFADRRSESTFGDLTLLVPEHTGWTATDQPTLYWFISKSVVGRIKLTLREEEADQPLLVTYLRDTAEAGLHASRLADYGVRLTPGVDYAWTLAVTGAMDDRDNRLVSQSSIRFVKPSATFQSTIERLNGAARVTALGNEGYWYDMFDAVSRLIAVHSQNQRLRDQRAGFLTQVGLAEVAALDNQ